MSDLLSLAKRCEDATGGDGFLDVDIENALGGDAQHTPTNGFKRFYHDTRRWGALPSYTHSLDAAVSLCERVLPGIEWEVTTLYGIGTASVGLNDAVNGHTGARANTPALAICAALLRHCAAAPSPAPESEVKK